MPTIPGFAPSAAAGPCPFCDRAGPFVEAPYPAGGNRRFAGARIVVCTLCGSGFVPDAAARVAGYYEDEYATANRGDRDIPPERYFAPDAPQRYAGPRAYFARAEDQVAELRRRGAAFGAWLDYGAGPGYLLHAARPAEACAVEADTHSAKYLDFIGARRLTDDSLPAAHFDVAVASHVAEHFFPETIAPLMDRLHAALKPGGLLLVEVPQGGHSYLLLGHRELPHTLFFSPEGLVRVVLRAGFAIVTAYARGKKAAPRRPDPPYAPPDDAFLGVARGGLTVIARRERG